MAGADACGGHGDGLDWRSLAEGQKGFGRLILKRYYKGIQALKKAIQRIRKPFFQFAKIVFWSLAGNKLNLPNYSYCNL